MSSGSYLLLLLAVVAGCDIGSRWAGHHPDNAPYPDVNDVDTSGRACMDRADDPSAETQNSDVQSLVAQRKSLTERGQTLWQETFVGKKKSQSVEGI